MPKRPAATFLALDPVFRALGDPTRRAVIARLARGPASTSELARPFAMALPSFAQHLDLLEACGLVRSRKAGRVRTYRLARRALASALRWLGSQVARADAATHPTRREGPPS